jgi:hypothetical protein
MPDYSKGVIYMLEPTVEYEAGDVYYGSTINSLYKRFHTHKKKKSDISSRHLFQKYGNNIKIVLVKSFPCNSKQELFAEEGKYIRENQCVNKQIAGRSKEEWRQDNKEEIKAYRKAYIQEHQEERKAYNQKHKEEIKEQKKAYRQEHKEKLKAYSKAYRQKHKEEIKQKIKCVCGCMISKTNLIKHKLSNKHTKLLADNITGQESV